MSAATSDNDGALRERRCIATGKVLPEYELVRFVVSPDGDIVPDLDAKLPGHGFWLSTTQAAFAKAATKGDFAKAAKAKVVVRPDLAAHVEQLLVARLKADLGMARRAGQADIGFDCVTRAFDKRIPPALLFEAARASDDGRRKLKSGMKSRGLDATVIDVLTREELSLAMGRENVVHAAIRPGALADRLVLNATRLAGLRGEPSDTKGPKQPAGRNESTL